MLSKSSKFSNLLKDFSRNANFGCLLNSKLVGLEKECLRINQDGQLANSNHPKELGATLTHPNITTDYAEAQLELITNPNANIKSLLTELHDLHSFIYQVSKNTFLWPASIPGNIPKAKDILVASYGTSVNAQFKELYRSGLGYRYGKNMQLMCGIHFNFSFKNSFWESFFKNNYNQDNINTQYMAIMRNYSRISWLITFLFGSSPAINNKFINEDAATANYLKLHRETNYIAPYGTSIRESNIGYNNRNTSELYIDYNSLNNYSATLAKAVATPDKQFTEIGKYRYDKQIQLNCNILQIENEYYSVIRPKPEKTKTTSLRPYKALQQNGIAYLEVRNIDLNPFSPVGIEANQCYLLELIMLYCCLQNSADFTPLERAKIKNNRHKVALLGRQPDAKLQFDNHYINLRDWALDILNDINLIADYLDQPYRNSVAYYKEQIEDPTLTNSGKIYHDLKSQQLNYKDYQSYFLELSKQHKSYFANHNLSVEKLDYYKKLAADSLIAKNNIEVEEKKNNIKLSQLKGVLFDA